ncbi:MAG: hypothetical protein VKN72_05635 [Nostocales cyanobacterium 94392]|nr:hypothetical protein [Nostocales cyanobacterium 94392]
MVGKRQAKIIPNFHLPGTRDFKSVQRRILFKISNSEKVSLELDNPHSNRCFCAAAMIKTISSEVVINKEEKYFAQHEEASKNYRFGNKFL